MRILLIADLHIGSIKDTNYIFNVTTNIIEKELVENKTNVIIFLGDFFHRLMKCNEEYTALAINIMSYIVRMCKRSKTKIRMIYGTESHEMSQYRLFNYHMNQKDVDFKVIDTVTEEELAPGVNVLYVPEEYIESKTSHYKKYFNKKYKYIFGHGVISEGMPMIKFMEENKSKEKKVPHFKSKELSSISDICVFGHYHVYSDMGNNCYYLGSLFRDSFGEEEDKGYGIIESDSRGDRFTFHHNQWAYVYKTITYNEDSDIYTSPERLVTSISTIRSEHDGIFNGSTPGKIRLVFKTPNDVSPSFREALRSVLFNDKHISPLIKESSEVVTEVQESIEEEYEFVLDNSLDVVDKIHRYINKHYENVTMSLEEINQYINEELKI